MQGEMLTDVHLETLLPGDILFTPSNSALMVIANNKIDAPHYDSYTFSITYMSLFGCAWVGILAVKYAAGAQAMVGHRVWRVR